MPSAIASRGRTRAWPVLIVLLLAMRAPSLAQPMGGDQGQYAYGAQRILAGDVPYRDTFDHKPAAMLFLYAALWKVWPDESVVAAADLASAALVALLLVSIGRRLFGPATGATAAALFLFWGDPAFATLGGLFVRGQCEPFVALAVTAAIAVVSPGPKTRGSIADSTRGSIGPAMAGVLLGVAFWLKYNAIVYLLPVLVTVWFSGEPDRRGRLRALALVAAGFVAVTAAVLAYFAAVGALADLRIATVDYNLRYSQETYASPLDIARYLVTLPLSRARVEMLWYLGGLGVLGLVAMRLGRPSYLVLSWLVAACLAIAANGLRDLPQYFVQAAPPLAVIAAAGLVGVWTRWPLGRVAIVVLVLAGLWRVGAAAPGALGWRWGGVPQAVERTRADWAAMTGRLDLASYLSRFRGRKYDAAAIDDVARHIAETTAPGSRVLVFGFTGGAVLAKAVRPSPTRFFWSRPVIIEFAADRPGFGSAGLLRDLEARPPSLVVLQRHDWNSEVDPIPDSADFFFSNPALRAWLDTGYAIDHVTPAYLVYRRVR